jgi:cyanophycinase-like exopeptidase
VTRLLVIMGSGETSPTMIKVHRSLFERLGEGAGPKHSAVPAVLLDTPVGFQENAEIIAAKAVEYFRESVGREMEVATWRRAPAADDPVGYETMLTRVRAARYVFAGPGSPSYALKQWAGSDVPDALAEKLRTGGCVTFASAAALTLGRFTVPVYEIYKVGDDPRWLDGLNLVAEAGLDAVVIPHFDNAEGGNHDTRFCYLGERRLAMMERLLPETTFVLGVDEHTACIIDLDAQTATVDGRGGVTVRRAGQVSTVTNGSTVPLTQLREMAERGVRPIEVQPPSAPPRPAPGAGESPLIQAMHALERAFDDALIRCDAPAAVRAVLELEQTLVDWSRDTLQSDELDRGRSALRSMIVRLGEVARSGTADPRETLGPFVEALLGARDRARADHRWSEADEIRDRLVAAGVEVRDTPAGTSWEPA